jgi:hypothetical protein
MDEHWEHEGQGQAKTTREKPSFYFKRQCWASCEAGEELAPVFIEHVGEDYLTIATDYPHSDCIGKFPDRTVGDLTTNDRISTRGGKFCGIIRRAYTDWRFNQDEQVSRSLFWQQRRAGEFDQTDSR